MTSLHNTASVVPMAPLRADPEEPQGRMVGRTCVVTGATSGIGYETALGLARMGATVIGVGRSAERCAAACAAIRVASGNPAVSYEVADLGSQAETRALARRIRGQLRQLHVLINNAGTFTYRRKLSPEGMELQLAVNYLAAFLLTHEFMPLLSAAPEARIITLSSGSHFGARLHWMDIGLGGRYSGLRAYGFSKLACILFTYELARRLGPESRISTFAVDPGLVKTDMGLKEAGPLVRLVWRARRRTGRTPAEGASSSIFLAADPAAPLDSGRYWKDRVAIPSSPQSYDAGAAGRLWKLSERLAGIGVEQSRAPVPRKAAPRGARRVASAAVPA